MRDPLQQYSRVDSEGEDARGRGLPSFLFRHVSLAPLLSRFSRAPDPLPLAALARLIGRFGRHDPETAIETLQAKLKHRSPIVRGEISRALFNLVPHDRREHGGIFLEMLEDSFAPVRRNGFRGLQKLGMNPDGACSTASELLTDKDASIRRSAAIHLLKKGVCVNDAIGALGAGFCPSTVLRQPGLLSELESVRGVLASVVQNDNYRILTQGLAMKLLATLPAPTKDEMHLFRECLASVSEAVRHYAALSLARSGYVNEAVITELVAIVKGDIANESDHILDTLRDHPRLASEALVDALPPYDFGTRKRLGRILLQMPTHAVSPLLDLIVHYDSKKRFAHLKRFATRLILAMGPEALSGLETEFFSCDPVRRKKAEDLHHQIVVKLGERIIRPRMWR